MKRRDSARHQCYNYGMTTQMYSAWVQREGDGWVSLCPQLDVASQGETFEEARENLREAVELFLETASPEEIQQRFHGATYMTPLEVRVG